MISLPYRVFNRKSKEMTYLPPLQPMVGPGGIAMGLASAIVPRLNNIQPGMHVIQPSDYIVMMACGLLSSERQMLFEGDIVEGDFEGFTDDGGMHRPEDYAVYSLMRRRGVILWEPMAAGFIFKPNDSGEYLDLLPVAPLTHVGNVYQHPERLKQAPFEPIPIETDKMTEEVLRSKCCNAPVEKRGAGTALECYGCRKCGAQCEIAYDTDQKKE